MYEERTEEMPLTDDSDRGYGIDNEKRRTFASRHKGLFGEFVRAGRHIVGVKRMNEG